MSITIVMPSGDVWASRSNGRSAISIAIVDRSMPAAAEPHVAAARARTARAVEASSVEAVGLLPVAPARTAPSSSVIVTIA